MEPEIEKPWRKDAPNELIVNSILAAIAAIVVQTVVSSGHPRYGMITVLTVFASLILFIASAEQISESIRDASLDAYIRSTGLYNIGVLMLFLALYALFRRYTQLKFTGSALSLLAVLVIWASRWGCDMAFLVFQNEDYQRWRRRLDGEIVDGDISDHCEGIKTVIRRRWNRILCYVRETIAST